MTVSVCVGSSCHLKGSYAVIEKLQELVKKYEIEDKVTLRASFCLGRCASGVTVKADDELLTGFTPLNTEELFVKEILSKLN